MNATALLGFETVTFSDPFPETTFALSFTCGSELSPVRSPNSACGVYTVSCCFAQLQPQKVSLREPFHLRQIERLSAAVGSQVQRYFVRSLFSRINVVDFRAD